MKHHIFLSAFFLFLILALGSEKAQAQVRFHSPEEDAMKILYDSLEGENWYRSNDKSSLLNVIQTNTGSPKVKIIKNSSGFFISTLDFTNNGLKGNIPVNFFLFEDGEYTDENITRFGNYRFRRSVREVDFGHNQITYVPRELVYLNGLSGTVPSIHLDHNQLKKFQCYYLDTSEPRGGVGTWGISGWLALNNNEIERISEADVTIPNQGTSDPNLFGTTFTGINIANNRMNFAAFKELQYEVVSGANAGRRGVNPYVATPETFVVNPQKALGETNEEVSLNEGENHSVSFVLKDPGNIYKWAKNGVELPFSEGQTYAIEGLSEDNAGVYTCWVTNSAYPNVTLNSQDFAVWLNKSDNKAPTNIQINNARTSPGTRPFSFIGSFSAEDEDEVFFRLPEDANYPYNSSFRIADGKQLMSSEDLFEHESIEEYKILVEAYDVFGGKTRKELTISRFDLPDGVRLVENVGFSASVIPENQATFQAGQLNFYAVNKKTNQYGIPYNETVYLNNEYNFFLPEGSLSNHAFELEAHEKFVLIKTKEAFDFETQKKLSISIRAEHKEYSDIFLEKVYSFNVSDANDSPNVLVLSENFIKDSDPSRTVVGSFLAADEDVEDTNFTYDLNENYRDAKNFEVNGRFLITKNKLTAGNYFIKANVYDQAGASLEKELIIIVLKTDDSGNVSKKEATIKNFDPLTKQVGEPRFALEAYSDSDSKLLFSVTEGQDIIELEGHNLTILKAGVAKVKASVLETDTYKAAEKTITVMINRAGDKQSATISDFEDLEVDILKGDFPLTAHSNSDAKVNYQLISGASVISLNGARVKLKSVGEARIKAVVESTNTYTSAEKIITLTVFGEGQKEAALINHFEDISLTEGDQSVVLSAQTNSNGKVQYRLLSGAEFITIDGAILSPIKTGSAEIEAFVDVTESFRKVSKIITVEVRPLTGKTNAVIGNFNHLVLFVDDTPGFLIATTNSSEKIRYEVISDNKQIVQIREPYIYPIGVGEARLRAYIEENENYTATEKIITIKVNGTTKLASIIENFDHLEINNETTDFHLTAYSDSDAKILYTIVSGSSIELEGAKVIIKELGETIIKAYVPATDRYKSAEKNIIVQVNQLLNVEKRATVKAYPNPTNQLINLSFDNASPKVIQVLTMDGQLIQALHSELQDIQIDLANQINGVYLIQIIENGKIQMIKIRLNR